MDEQERQLLHDTHDKVVQLLDILNTKMRQLPCQREHRESLIREASNHNIVPMERVAAAAAGR